MSSPGGFGSQLIYCGRCEVNTNYVNCRRCNHQLCRRCSVDERGICIRCSFYQNVQRSSSNADKSRQTTSLKVAVTEKYCQTEPSESLGCDCASSQFSLQSAKQTLQDFKELFLGQVDCDVTLNVQGKEFQAHKAILVARSSVFASTFRSNMIEKASGVVNIEDCDPSCFADFLCFLYCGKAENITTENVYSLFMTANKYQVKDLRLECLEFMKKNLSTETFCETITLSLQHLEKELTDISIDFFERHWQEIIVTAKWQSFVIDHPVQSNEIMIKTLLPKKE